MNINPFLVECRHEVLELKSFSISKDEERASEVIAVYGYVKLKQEVFWRNWFFYERDATKKCYKIIVSLTYYTSTISKLLISGTLQLRLQVLILELSPKVRLFFWLFLTSL